MLWKILTTLLIGAIAGWLAGKIMGCRGSLFRNILLGLVGSVVGGAVAGLLNIYAGSWIGSILISAAGACLCIFLTRKLRQRRF